MWEVTIDIIGMDFSMDCVSNFFF